MIYLIFFLSLYVRILLLIYIIRPELSASLFWAALRWINVKDLYQHWGGHHNTREKPTGCTQWPLSVCMRAAEGMPTPLWKWTLCREHASHYHLGVTTSVSSVFMRPGWKSKQLFYFIKPQMLLFFEPCIFSSSAIISPKEIITVLMCGCVLTARVTNYRPKDPQTRDMHVVL